MDHAVAQFLIDYDRRTYNYRHVNKPTNTKTAVIVDTRSAFFLPLVIKNFMSILGPSWNLRVFHGRANEMFLRRSLPGWQIHLERLELHKLDQASYSRLLKSEDFWQRVPEEHILVFQMDTVLFRPIPESSFRYDMIGAPCGRDTINGGLSLRKKSAMIRCIRTGVEEIHSHPDEAEDIFFTRRLRQDNQAAVPDKKTCAMFSAESYAHPECIGGHGTDKYYLSSDQWRSMILHLRI